MSTLLEKNEINIETHWSDTIICCALQPTIVTHSRVIREKRNILLNIF